jgi:TRAP-type C4-dicarboxylate transport system substrate-binding protein
VLAAAGLAAPFLPRFAKAATTVWRIGHSAPANFALHLRLTEVAAAVAAQTSGQMAIEVHPNSELGSPVGLFAQLRAGTIEGMPLTNQLLANNLAIGALPTVGFAFSGYDRLWPAIDGDLGKFLRAQMAQRLGIVAMDRCWDFGFRQVTTSGKVINSAADIEGLKLRTPPEADFVELFRALKALPLAMPLSAMETALRSHVIDGQESVLPLVKAANLFTVQSVCSMTNHVWDGQWMCVNGKAWAHLPANLKEVVAGAFNESALKQRQDTADANAAVRKELEVAGMKFNAVDTQGFRTLLRKSGYYAAWSEKMGNEGWAVLEKYAGRLT